MFKLIVFTIFGFAAVSDHNIDIDEYHRRKAQRKAGVEGFGGISETYLDSDGYVRIKVCNRPDFLCNIKGWSGVQLEMAELIANKFSDAGYDFMIPVALATVKEESNFDPNMEGDYGNSIGLFQLNANGGLGIGLSKAYRSNPENNIDVILKEIAAYDKRTGRITSAKDNPDALMKILTMSIMRPKNPEVQAERRIEVMYDLFPEMVF